MAVKKLKLILSQRAFLILNRYCTKLNIIAAVQLLCYFITSSIALIFLLFLCFNPNANP